MNTGKRVHAGVSVVLLTRSSGTGAMALAVASSTTSVFAVSRPCTCPVPVTANDASWGVVPFWSAWARRASLPSTDVPGPSP